MKSTLSGKQIQRKLLPTIDLVQSSNKIRWLARFVLIGLLLWILGMFFLPWQQTARGTGRVMAFVPQERQQTVNSPVEGIVAQIKPGLREGDFVQKDDVILELLPAASSLVQQVESQIRELKTKLEAVSVKEQVYAKNVIDYTEARDYAVRSAQETVEASMAKLRSKLKLVPAYEAKELQARLNYERFLSLKDSGARPEREVEILKKDLDVARAELDSLHDEIAAAEFEVESKRHELEQRRSEAQTKIESAQAFVQSAVSEGASVRKEIRELEIKLEELQQLTIRAPRDGTIFRLPLFELSQVVRKGEALFTIVPETSDLAVELWISGLDIPLVQVGDHVRIQFEGYPAVQFPGWPSVAVGTFGGQVVAIDDSDDGEGKFRIQVIPDPAEKKKWPPPPFLRQGVRANGWVMLQQVSLGYEIWRLMNGFPVIRPEIDPVYGKSTGSKLKKVD